MTASNVVAFGNQTGVVDRDYIFDSETNTNTGTVIISGTSESTYCAVCGVWHSGWCQCMGWNWHPYYVFPPLPKSDEVGELKAWIDGFMEGRKMTERNLQKVRDKLEEFCN